jgi:hypothetical protein
MAFSSGTTSRRTAQRHCPVTPSSSGPCERFTIRSSQKVPQPRLEHPAGISRVRSPPQKPIAFPAHLDQLDQQLTRSPIANFDAHHSHCMAAVSGLRRRCIQNVMPPSLLMQGMDQLVHESRWFEAKLLTKKRLILAVGADGLGSVSLCDLHLHDEATRAFTERLGLCRG